MGRLTTTRLRHWAHPLAGITSAFSYLLSPFLPIACIMAFISYEVVQDWRCGTNSYKDIFEFITPFFVTVVILLILKGAGYAITA